MLYSLLRLSCRKMGGGGGGLNPSIGFDLILRRNGLILRRNSFQAIIIDDFLKKGSVTADNYYLTHSL